MHQRVTDIGHSNLFESKTAIKIKDSAPDKIPFRLVIVCRSILRSTKDTAVAFSLFGYFSLDSGLAGAETIVGTDVFALFIFDYHIAGAPALAIEQLVSRQPHQDTFRYIMVGIVNPPKLIVDLVGELLCFFEFSQKVVGTHIDLLHRYPFSLLII